jgi:hypothetical protein
MSNNLIYYFLIANYNTKKEIGEYYEESEENNINLSKIKSSAKEIVLSNDKKKEKTNKIAFQEYNFYYKITNLDILYLAVVKKNIKYKENLIFELIEDIDHQGIKKLVDKNGELTIVGKQNLKFSIENYQEFKKKKESKIFINSFFEPMIPNENEEEDNNQLINEDNITSKNNIVENVKNMIINIKNKENSSNNNYQIQKSDNEIQLNLRCQSIRNKIIILFLFIGLIYAFYRLF